MSLSSISKIILKSAAILVGGSIFLLILVYAIGTSIIIPLESAKEAVAFKELIGSSYRITEDFQALGITDDLNKRNLEYQLIYPSSSVGFSNRNVIHRKTLAEGTVLKLTDVLVSEWSMVAPKTKYVLSTQNEHFRLDKDWFKGEYLTLIPEKMPNHKMKTDGK